MSWGYFFPHLCTNLNSSFPLNFYLFSTKFSTFNALLDGIRPNENLKFFWLTMKTKSFVDDSFWISVLIWIVLEKYIRLNSRPENLIKLVVSDWLSCICCIFKCVLYTLFVWILCTVYAPTKSHNFSKQIQTVFFFLMD